MCLSYTRSSLMCISSMRIHTYLSLSGQVARLPTSISCSSTPSTYVYGKWFCELLSARNNAYLKTQEQLLCSMYNPGGSSEKVKWQHLTLGGARKHCLIDVANISTTGSSEDPIALIAVIPSSSVWLLAVAVPRRPSGKNPVDADLIPEVNQ